MKRILSYMIVTLLLAMCGLGAHAQSPQTGVYRIQNVGSKLYVKVTGKYAAEPNESAQAEASTSSCCIATKKHAAGLSISSVRLFSLHGSEKQSFSSSARRETCSAVIETICINAP